MTSWIDLTNFAFISAGLALTLAGLILAFFSRNIEHWTRSFILWIFIFTFAYLACAMISELSFGLYGPKASRVSSVAMFLQSTFSGVLLPILLAFLLYVAGEDMRKRPLPKIATCLWVVYMVFLVYNEFNPLFYEVTSSNTYRRGPYYPVLLVPTALLMAANLIALFAERKKLPKRQFAGFFSYMVIPLLAMLIQMRLYGLLLVTYATTIAALSLFIRLLQVQEETTFRQQEENARQHIDIMLLQMRPHFIHNTLSSIYYLCETDPLKAQQMLRDFSTYLRKYFESVSKQALVPLAEELEHVQAYLNVEKIRFANRLSVSYDTPVTHFKLPPLTIQPLVENAVKHGVDPELPPLHIKISTRENVDAHVIIVENSGPVFDAASDNRVHVGLRNVRERLHLICGGSLTVTSYHGRGVTATITLPKSGGVLNAARQRPRGLYANDNNT